MRTPSVRCVFSRTIPLRRRDRCAPHDHVCAEIVYCSGSGGILHQGGEVMEYADQSLFVYQPGRTHWVANERKGEHVCLGLVGEGVARIVPGMRSANPSLAAYFAELHRARGLGDEWHAVRLNLLSGLILCELLTQQGAGLARPESRASQARRIIENELTGELSVTALAERLGLNGDYLRALFREEFGEPIHGYILRRRLELAGQLLRATPLPIKEIAAQAGFPNEFYFSRLFRRRKGLSPTEWRQSGR